MLLLLGDKVNDEELVDGCLLQSRGIVVVKKDDIEVHIEVLGSFFGEILPSEEDNVVVDEDDDVGE